VRRKLYPRGQGVSTIVDRGVQETPAFRAARERDAALTRTQATPAGAFRAARRMFLRGQRLDMRSLAGELGISRATLYRWCGDRERLLSDVLWSLSHQLFEQAKTDHPKHTGATRVLAVVRQHTSSIVRAKPLHVFLQHDTHAALRLLTSESGGVQPRTVGDLADLMREEQELGGLELRAEVDHLAYAIVRMTEGFIYHDTVVGTEPDVERAARVVALLLDRP
jgi:AcrR family transcriptional regulator